MYIKNCYHNSLGLLSGVTLQSGEAKYYESVDLLLANQIIARWVEKGLLQVMTDAEYARENSPEIEEFEAPEPDPVPQAEPDEQDKLLAELAELGIKRDRRTGVEKLKALIAEARAKQSADTSDEQDAE